MIQQRWFQFDFALATKLADYLGKDRKFSKCRDIFDQIVNQGHVPSESTFHILTVAYLSAPIQGCLEEACSIYNRTIQLGGYSPRLSLHNSLFKALVSKPGGSSKSYLKQAEFIFHNLVTSGLEVHKEVYAGLIWLHSYQDVVDMVRIADLREEMHSKGIDEGKDVLVSILRACAKERNVEEAERTWIKVLESGCGLPCQAFVHRLEVYAKTGQPMKSLGIFREMQDLVPSTSVITYHKIIEVMSKAQEMEIAEALLREFIDSGLKPLVPAFVDVLTMYSDMGLHDKVESAFSLCLSKCRPNRTIYNIYLDSLVSTGKLEKAEETLNIMQANTAVGVNSRSCNIILGGYLASGEFVKAEKVYDVMCQKKFDVDPPLMEKIDYVLSLNRKVVKKPISLKLDKEQREILIALLLGGARIVSDEERRNHAIHFEFDENCNVHQPLKKHIHDCYYEWLNSDSRVTSGDDEIPCCFSTITHSYFGFFADQFWPKGQPTIPKLIHRWLSARVLAYWYMYGGHRSSSGDILLKLKGANREDLERIVRTLKEKSLKCRVKIKGKVSWITFQGSNAVWFWKLTEPYILDDLKYLLSTDGQTPMNGVSDDQHVGFDTECDSDEEASDHNGNETLFDRVQHDSAQDIQD
ncbi:Pentatricopeptide repeat-containing protein [Asimina triloba]